MMWIRAGVILFTALILQLELFADLRITGVSAQLLLALSAAAGLTGGAYRGTLFGFAAGLSLDLFLSTPFGLSAAAYALAGGLVGLAEDAVLDGSMFTRVGFPALGTVVGLVAFVSGGVAMGYTHLYSSAIGRIILIVMLFNALLGLILVPLTRWMWDLDWNDPGRRWST